MVLGGGRELFGWSVRRARGVSPAADVSSFDGVLAALASAPRWDVARTDALVGEVDQIALKHWARNVRDRHGPGAVAKVQRALGPWADVVPLEPQAEARIAVAAQARLTEAVADALHGGALLPLAALTREDVRRDVSTAARLGLRAYGAVRALRHVPEVHAKLYDVGEATVDVRRGAATVRYRGAALFAQPTWRFLVAVSLGLAVEGGAGRPPREARVDGDDDAFEIELGW